MRDARFLYMARQVFIGQVGNSLPGGKAVRDPCSVESSTLCVSRDRGHRHTFPLLGRFMRARTRLFTCASCHPEISHFSEFFHQQY